MVWEGTDIVVWATLARFGCGRKAWIQVPGQEWPKSKAKIGRSPPSGPVLVTAGEGVARVSGRMRLASSQFSVLSCRVTPERQRHGQSVQDVVHSPALQVHREVVVCLEELLLLCHSVF